MAFQPDTKLDSRNLVIRKLALHGIGDACVGTDEAGNEYQAIIFLGPHMSKATEDDIQRNGEECFRRYEEVTAQWIWRGARCERSLLDARPHMVTD